MKVEQCKVCSKNKEKVKFKKTYNNTFIACCPECSIEMDRTLQCMKISTKALIRRKSHTLERSYSKFVVSPIGVRS